MGADARPVVPRRCWRLPSDVPDVITPGATDRLSRGETGAMADAVAGLLRDCVVAMAMGCSARQHQRREFDLDTTADPSSPGAVVSVRSPATASVRGRAFVNLPQLYLRLASSRAAPSWKTTTAHHHAL